MKTTITASVDIAVAIKLEAYATALGINKSRAVVQLIERGIRQAQASGLDLAGIASGKVLIDPVSNRALIEGQGGK